MYSNPYAAEFDSDDTTATISTINGVKEGRTFVYAHEEGVNDDGSAMNCTLNQVILILLMVINLYLYLDLYLILKTKLVM